MNDRTLAKYWTVAPGVYQVRLVKNTGTPIKIKRILGVDPSGLLYIGMAREGRNGGLCNRLWGFWTAIEGTDESYHGAGKKFKRLLAPHFPNSKIQYRHKKIATGNLAADLEKKCLNDYQQRWGELPPLNRQGVE